MTSLTVSYQIAITLLVPLVVGTVFTYLSIRIASRTAKENAKLQNDLSARMKLADFRQAWINQLRDALADFVAHATTNPDRRKDDEILNRLATKIRLLVDKNDPNYPALSDYLATITMNCNDAGRSKLIQELTPVSQELLKKEWEVLKRDLNYTPISEAVVDPSVN